MTLQDAIGHLLERGTAMQTFWGFYITISLGLVVFFANAKASPRLPYLAALISLGFIAFAWVNCSGMTDIAEQRQFFYKLLEQASPPTAGEIRVSSMAIDQLKQITRPPSPESVRYFHIGVDIAVLVALWLLVLWPTKATAGLDK